jgi:hypothetical protein
MINLETYERIELTKEVIKSATHISKIYGLDGIEYFMTHFQKIATDYIQSLKENGRYSIDIEMKEKQANEQNNQPH